MAQNARIVKNSDFQQIALPLDLAIGEHILQRVRLEADSQLSTWYELYLVVTPTGFLIEKHSGSSMGQSRLKETWFRQTIPEAKRKYSQLLSSRRNHGKSKGVNDEKEGQQKLFD
jgi:hypothetical protein